MTSELREALKGWDEVDDLLQRRCSLPEYRRVLALFSDMASRCDTLIQARADYEYGRGHREGRELGRRDGWAERDQSAAMELAGMQGRLDGVRIELELERSRQSRQHDEAQLRRAMDTIATEEPDIMH